VYEHARALLRRNRPADRARAAGLAAEAAAASAQFGLPALADKVRALGLVPAGAGLPDGLSPREVAVLRLIASGRTNREIGRELFISEHTTANHVRSILRKTGCANRTDAAAYAYRRGLVSGAGAG